MPLNTPRFKPLPGQLGEEALDGVEPGGRGWGEVEMEPLVPAEPGLNLGMLVGGVVVDDQVEFLAGRGLAVDLVEEADEFLMPMARHACPMTLPSRTSRAANSVVVPFLL